MEYPYAYFGRRVRDSVDTKQPIDHPSCSCSLKLEKHKRPLGYLPDRRRGLIKLKSFHSSWKFFPYSTRSSKTYLFTLGSSLPILYSEALISERIERHDHKKLILRSAEVTARQLQRVIKLSDRVNVDFFCHVTPKHHFFTLAGVRIRKLESSPRTLSPSNAFILVEK